MQLTDKFSFGLLYDQPFGADTEYSGNNAFVASPSDPILSGLPITTGALGGTQGGTSVEVDSQNISMIFGFQPTENFNFYGGGVYQTIKGNVHLRGSAYSVYNGYDVYSGRWSSWLVSRCCVPDSLRLPLKHLSHIALKLTTKLMLMKQLLWLMLLRQMLVC